MVFNSESLRTAEKRAVIYARVSDRRQLEPDLSIPSQLEAGRARACELGAVVAHEFVDEALSGRTDRRPAFLDAINYCELNRVEYLITWSSSRLARNRFDAAIHKRRLDKCGTKIVYLSFAVDRDTPSGMLFDGFLELVDEQKSIQTSMDTKRSMIRHVQQGYWHGGHPPYGFRLVVALGEKKSRLQADPDEAETVRHIFDLRLAGFGAKDIAMRLNEAGEKMRGGVWRKATVLGILRNEAAIGRSVFNRRDSVSGARRPRDQWIVVDSHQAIVAPEVWERAQALITAAAPAIGEGSPRSTHLFTGLLRGPDGGAMTIETATGRSRRYSYYNCRDSVKNGIGPARRVPAEALDAWLLDVVLEKILTKGNLTGVWQEMERAVTDWDRDRAARRARLAAKLAGIESSNARLYEVLELHGRDAPNLGDLTTRLRANNAQIKSLEREIGDIEGDMPPTLNLGPEDVAELAESLRAILKEPENARKTRQLLATFIERVQIGDNEVQITYRPESLVQLNPVHSKGNWLPRTDSNRRPGD